MLEVQSSLLSLKPEPFWLTHCLRLRVSQPDASSFPVSEQAGSKAHCPPLLTHPCPPDFSLDSDCRLVPVVSINPLRPRPLHWPQTLPAPEANSTKGLGRQGEEEGSCRILTPTP